MHKNVWARHGGLVPRTAPQTHPQPCALNVLVPAYPLTEEEGMLPWSWDPCSLDRGSHCFCTSNSRGKNPCKGFIPLGFQISSLLVFLFRRTLSLSLFLLSLFLKLTLCKIYHNGSCWQTDSCFCKIRCRNFNACVICELPLWGPLPPNRVCDLITSKGNGGEMQNVTIYG